MRKFLLVITAGVLFTNLAMGQAKDNGIKLNPLGLLFGAVNIQYERAISESNSVQLGASFISLSLFDTKLTGYGVSPEFRIYPSSSKEALDGFYLAPVLSFNSLTLENTDVDSKATLTTFGGGAKLGWNWLLGANDSFIIDLGLGASYLSSNLKVESGGEDDFDFGAFDGMRPIINFGLGYAF